jgi:ABC-type nickel/cobalt efflux system permease component RcnA
LIADLGTILGIGFVLGFRHAFEPDHLAAVSTLATRQGTLRQAARLGLSWGVGHSAAVGTVVLLLIVTGVHLPPGFFPVAEMAVAALLIGLGGTVLWRSARRHRDSLGLAHAAAHAAGVPHRHERPTRDTRNSLGFGIAHGLAGSGAVVVLMVATTTTRGAQLGYLAAFGMGTVVGMMSVSATVALAARRAAREGNRWAGALQLGAAAMSVVMGVVLAGATLAAR